MTQVSIKAIATGHPEHDIHANSVAHCAEFLERENPSKVKLYKSLIARSGLEHRYSPVSLASPIQVAETGMWDDTGWLKPGSTNSTAERNEVYTAAAKDLALKTVRNLGHGLSEVTDLITVSCTGFNAPGFDIDIFREFGLNPRTERYQLGFMGCFAGINGLRLAQRLIQAEPHRKVLLVCLELCSLHFQLVNDLEKLLGFSLFADGCAAVLLEAGEGRVTLGQSQSSVHTEMDSMLTWSIGDQGFDLGLSVKLPAAVTDLMSREDLVPQSIRPHIHEAAWVVHPGGKGILRAVQQSAGLDEAQLAPSHAVLKRIGNASSTTVLFVMQEWMKSEFKGPGLGLAFGPGFGVEALGLRFH